MKRTGYEFHVRDAVLSIGVLSKCAPLPGRSGREAGALSGVCSLRHSGWRSAALYPLACGGRGIWRGDFGGARLLDRRRPPISF